MALTTIEGKGQHGFVFGDSEVSVQIPSEAILSMFLISNVWLIGPVFDMTILDGGGAVLNPMPSDGMKMQITVGDAISPAIVHEFRCVGSPAAVQTPLGPAITISAILDVPKLFYGLCRTSVNDTSSNAISKLAQECGLIIEQGEEIPKRLDVSSGDSMKWLPMGRKYGLVLGDIAAHGWFGEDSAASVVAVTLDKQVVYRDLAKVAKAKATHTFYYGVAPPADAENALVAHGASYLDQSTVGIGQQGYTATRTRFGLDGIVEKLSGVSVTLGNERLNISSDIKEVVGLSRAVLSALDCGNTHKHYEQAAYQNARYRATYGRQIALVIARQSQGVDLLDPVVIKCLDAKTLEPKEIHGIVSAKIKAKVNGYYVERFNIDYQGEDADVLI